MINKIIKTENLKSIKNFEKTLRPQTFDEYIGQNKIKETIPIYIKAAKKRNDLLDHILLYGPPGLGKTTLAMVIANELNVKIKVISGSSIEKPGDIIAILNSIKEGDILFIDEIHRINNQVEEILYSAMEDFCVDIYIGNSEVSKSLRHKIPKFTLIGATTRIGLLTKPLIDRFGVINYMEFYSDEDLFIIIKNSAKKLNTDIHDDAAKELASRSRGTPRLANRLLKRVRDFADIKNNSIINLKIAKEALDILEIDKSGLDVIDKLILETIILKYDGGPVGIDTICTSIGEDKVNIEDICEPYLIKKGYIKRTKRGRIATTKAYNHLGINIKK